MKQCKYHSMISPCEEATFKIGKSWFCMECAGDLPASEELNPRDDIARDEREAFNDRLEAFRNEQ